MQQWQHYCRKNCHPSAWNIHEDISGSRPPSDLLVSRSFSVNQMMVCLQVKSISKQQSYFKQNIIISARLSRGKMQSLFGSTRANRRRDSDKNLGPMLPETRELLEEYYRPFNHRLVELLGDEKYYWNDIWTGTI